MNAASSVYSADSFILEDSNDLIAFHWDEPGNGWRFTDGVTPITGSGDSFSFGDRLVFHIVAGPTGMTIYKNGVSYASTGTGYTAPAASATYMYIGSDDDGANQMFVTFMDLATFDANFSSAQVLADYNNIVQVINDDRQASPLPFLWSDDGDDIVDNGLDTSLENYVVCAGIPGSLPAQTEIFGALSSNWSNVFSVWFSLITLDHFVLPTTVLYADESGTVQAGNVGGQYRQTSVGTAVEGVLVGDLVISSQDREKFLELLGKEYYLMARIYDAGSTLQIASRLLVGGSSIGLETEFKAISTTTGERQYVTQPLVIFNQTDFFLGAKFNKLGTQFPTTDAQFILLARRTSGTANIRVDYIAVLPRPACRLQGNFAAANFIYRGTSGIITDSNLIFQKQLSHTGDAIELVPGKYNTLMMYLGDESGNSTVSWTLTYNNIYVTPRYALL
jgi:hypothetical protein